MRISDWSSDVCSSDLYPFARGAAAAAAATLVTVEGAGHSWMLEDPDSLPAMLAQLLDGPLGEAIDDRARGSIDDMLAPDALARSLDRPRSRPYRPEPRHRWQVEADWKGGREGTRVAGRV